MPKRVLIVDDDHETRGRLVECLGELGYEPHVALDGDHALRSALALRPDLILLDVYLPSPAFALGFATRYRERVSPDSRAPIFAMSASSDLVTLAQQIGANETVSKPFDLDDLAKLLAKFLGEPEPTLAAAEPEPAGLGDLVAQPETGQA